jgi:hypothetical protein
MRRFFSNLLRDFRPTRSARGGRRAPRRTTLQLEGLEDRLALSTVTSAWQFLPPTTFTSPTGDSATQIGSTLTINTVANTPLSLNSNGAGQIELSDNLAHDWGHFNIQSINAVTINLPGGNAVTIDDSNGLPFASGTTVALQGNQNSHSSLTLSGSGVVGGNEQFVAADIYGNESLSFANANVKFLFNNAVVNSVTDTMQITGFYDVQTSGTNVELGFGGPGLQTLDNLAAGSPLGTLSYANKSQIILEEYLGNAVVDLVTSSPEALESSFVVEMHGAGDSTIIGSTPSTVTTTVVTSVSPVPNGATVDVWGNLGPVAIQGNASTAVKIGYPFSSNGTTTQGIQGNVIVGTASHLYVVDNGNVSTQENVTVTESTISGTGLFGNSNVTLTYRGVGLVSIGAGTQADNYTVIGSQPNAVFTSRIDISSHSDVGFRADVFVNSASHLNLSLFNEVSQVPAQLFVHPSSDGTAVFAGTLPNGFVDVLFGGMTTSTISYNGFTTVGL